MLRTARIAIPDILHHITQRGNNRQDVFFVDDDGKPGTVGLLKKSPASRIIPSYINPVVISSMEV
jgi:REP element-mobilizing transposase RayT